MRSKEQEEEEECQRTRGRRSSRGLAASATPSRKESATKLDQLAWALWTADWSGCRLLLHPGQQGQGHHVERGDAGRVSEEAQEVHPRHQDGLRRAEEGEGPGGPDHLLGEGHQVDCLKHWHRDHFLRRPNIQM